MERYIPVLVLTISSVFGLSTGSRDTSPLECHDQHCINNTCLNEKCPLGCKEGYFGPKCPPCSSGCKNRKCLDGGICTEGCIDGYWGDTCGVSCSSSCGKCHRDNGAQCETCDKYSYGESCKSSCKSKCPEFGCDRDGTCRSCSAYCKCDVEEDEDCIGACFLWNSTCLYGCKKGYYGQQCEHTCNRNCAKSMCNTNTGRCTNGCHAGFYGKFCVRPCSKNCLYDLCRRETGICKVHCKPGFYGLRCENQCHKHCRLNQCNREDGFCVNGTRKHGDQDSATTPDTTTNYTLYIIIGALSVLLCFIVGGILFARFHKPSCLEKRRETVHPTEKSFNRTLPDLPEDVLPASYYEINEDEMDPSNQSLICLNRELHATPTATQLRALKTRQVPRLGTKETSVSTMRGSETDDELGAFTVMDYNEMDPGNLRYHEVVPEVIQEDGTSRHLMSDDDVISCLENSVYRKGLIGRQALSNQAIELCIPKQYLHPVSEEESYF